MLDDGAVLDDGAMLEDGPMLEDVAAFAATDVWLKVVVPEVDRKALVVGYKVLVPDAVLGEIKTDEGLEENAKLEGLVETTIVDVPELEATISLDVPMVAEDPAMSVVVEEEEGAAELGLVPCPVVETILVAAELATVVLAPAGLVVAKTAPAV